MSHRINVAEMSPHEVHKLMANKQIVLVDVREPDEYAVERIHGALLYPLSSFDAEHLPTEDERPIVLHCAGGMRSLSAANRRLAAGIKAATHMKGGINAWKAAGLPTIKVDPATGQLVEQPH
jgi:rhodanese-related sulfurtransferase